MFFLSKKLQWTGCKFHAQVIDIRILSNHLQDCYVEKIDSKISIHFKSEQIDKQRKQTLSTSATLDFIFPL